jgi:hypothetical protein
MLPLPMFQFFLSASFQGIEDFGRGISKSGGVLAGFAFDFLG